MVYLTVLPRVRKKEAFSYPLFAQYVVNIDILEEIMYLASEKVRKKGDFSKYKYRRLAAAVQIDTQGGGLALELFPGGGLAGARPGTRGANRGEKEDFR